ncbi:enoyl-CoA hydratase/isomerase family protein [Variovorax sp. Sphag1AA]|uniref:enoyl-CoA hydratase/isomerase family protein n=1 Tax=Variovorax sp. Sphag1AA TaxID=2587027 RepID=UPI0017BA9D4D|nr:enoyl-CoA hydratase-related protein [Variovorax sp. Sphag1AA]MBB3177802.1 2-(1,2-epoxy-1,2-dihydrophenyl)acetyl-CoA isomerase [Variovorax sp. Sphag1AA]
MNEAMQQADGVAWGVSDRIGRIVLKRGDRANSISSGASRGLVRAIDEVLDSKPRVVLLAAEGRVFCAGGDIEEFVAAGPALDALVDEILEPLHPALYRLATAPLPVISVVNGPVGGAGIGLALCADFVLAAESMKLRTGYAAIGLSPDVGASFFLARRVGAVRAQQWLMLSDAIDARECLARGAVDSLHPDGDLQAAAEALAHRLANAASGSLAAIKTLCSGLPGRDLQAHLRMEHALLAERAHSDDAREGVRAFMERRAPRF